MTTAAYYNENDPFAAAWLRNLIAAGAIADGYVDERSIEDVQPEDLEGFDQCHFFAGIGGWSYALRLAGWPDGKRVWTGSCPCQPFSVAGKRKGEGDKRHLWPEFYRLIAQCDGGEYAPPVVFGEQVASKDGRQWLAGVRADVEALGYAVGAADLCAASCGADGEVGLVRGGEIEWEPAVIGAPHIRQRLYWVAEPQEGGWRSGIVYDDARKSDFAGGRETERLGLPILPRLEGHAGDGTDRDQPGWDNAQPDRSASEAGGTGRLGNTEYPERGAEHETHADAYGRDGSGRDGKPGGMEHPNIAGPDGRLAPGGEQPLRNLRSSRGFWSAFDILPCLDGKARRIEPGTFPLAHGVRNRMGKLRGYGNAIAPPLAAEFIRAYLETVP